MVRVSSQRHAMEAIRWAQQRRQNVTVLGGGSNVVIADDGVDGLVLEMAVRGLEYRRERDVVLAKAGAGEHWDEVVEDATSRGLAGLECLSGIPGLVGATPIQNVGAYGQEAAHVIHGVQVLDIETLEIRSLGPEDCGFGYRDSVFRRNPGRWLVLEVTFKLRPEGDPTLAYRELERALAARESVPSIADVREVVLDLRRGKSMVFDSSDPNRRSAGSFFINPVVDLEALTRAERCGRAAGALGDEDRIPSFDLDGGAFKIPAGWLIERAGFRKGLRRGPVGISSAHALALVHHGGGTAADLVALAREIRDGVRRVFGIDLRPEPVFLGFGTSNPLEE
jgi:UDP-N-acetylmuramate dehydrogenase